MVHLTTKKDKTQRDPIWRNLLTSQLSLSSTEIKVMFKAIQNTMAEILQENQNLKEEFKELKAQIRGQDRKIQEIKDSFETSDK